MVAVRDSPIYGISVTSHDICIKTRASPHTCPWNGILIQPKTKSSKLMISASYQRFCKLLQRYTTNISWPLYQQRKEKCVLSDKQSG